MKKIAVNSNKKVVSLLNNFMPRVFITLTILLQFFIVPTALATSGACSGHEGVNCAAGPDSDGSVICYDGWRNSSVSYSSMVMCGGSTTTKAVTPTATTLSKTVSVPTTTTKTTFVSEIDDPIVDGTDQWENTGLPEEEPAAAVDEAAADDQEDEPSESSPGETAAGLGILGGMGYALYRAGKKVVSLIK